MKKVQQGIAEFKETFENDFGVKLGGELAGEALENLVNFFDLLWRFDQENKERLKEMKIKQNGGRIRNTRSL